MARIETGMLRSLLQPVIFGKLGEDLGALKKGDYVALQYWGNGKVTVTRFPDGVREVNVAHSLNIQDISPSYSHSDADTVTRIYGGDM